MAERTGARLDTVDIADGSGWQVESTDEADVFTKGAVTIEVRYSANDAVESAIRRAANGDVERIGEHAAAKVDQVRSWLTGRNDYQEQAEADITTGPTAARSQLYWEFWLQFRDRVATEHPDWKARAGTSRTSPNATLPAGTPRTIFCSAFKPGPLRLELAFVDPDPAVNLARFEALQAKKDQLERAFGESVVWDEMAGKNDTRVYVVSPFESIDDRDQWPTMMDWLIEQHVRFKRAIEAVGGLDVGRTIRGY
ncbi:DUF4268 domain-containing protein [Mycobacterium colombiense]|uniref:DUF4268 domain-containing protein n=1 Tax=Mycobacterium colombiense TaxID=339268 RepID=A0A1A2Z4I4_9MYCO|nr:DUF4268 domain-containing protein [Mycobacterium colombiense]OBI45200.1 hypothetical protein A5708_15400 [Mycobacterium colombiense]